MGFRTTELRDKFNDAMEAVCNVSQPKGQDARKGRMTAAAGKKETGVLVPTQEDFKAVIEAETAITSHSASRGSATAA